MEMISKDLPEILNKNCSTKYHKMDKGQIWWACISVCVCVCVLGGEGGGYIREEKHVNVQPIFLSFFEYKACISAFFTSGNM